VNININGKKLQLYSLLFLSAAPTRATAAAAMQPG
jgi:hypothetical protein